MSDEVKEIKHIGTPRHSGRYPWGSGRNPVQRTKTWLSNIEEMHRKGMSNKEISEAEGISVTELIKKKSIAKAAKRADDRAFAIRLLDKGYSKSAIGRRMDINESSVRALLDDALDERSKILEQTADILRESVDTKKYVDVGIGVERGLGIARTKFTTAIAVLEAEGYQVHDLYEEQPSNPGKYTRLQVLVPPGVTREEVSRNRSELKLIDDVYTDDGGRNWNPIETPKHISSDRVHIRYEDDGGNLKDGVIELRRGVEDLSLGDKRYAQVRIGVNGTHYLKGMAIYADDLPNGADIIYNTNKKKGTPKEEVFKSIEDDPNNPFKSSIRQKKYIDDDGKEQLSALNIVSAGDKLYEEGAWRDWSKTLSSQVLSKQSPALAKKQLTMDADQRKDALDEILSVTNPAVRKRLLDTYADDTDAAAVHLKAAALPRQSNHVILPLITLKEKEVYAPTFNDGEVVVLIRHPHGGIFEIPELIVNNKNREGRSVIGQAEDAVGINPKVAKKLSGADFDGDTVLVIPNKNRSIQTSPAIKALTDFEPRIAYKGYVGMPVITPKMKEQKMGDVSNLITDMTIKGANQDEIARAVRHSMVVIDAEKHKLNYKQSYDDNGIAALKQKYQGSKIAGASTIISKASSEKRVDHRKDRGTVTTLRNTDPITGKKIYETTGKTYIRKDPVIDPITGKKMTDPKTGKRLYVEGSERLVKRQTKTTKMAEETDAFKLSSGQKIETVYASYANDLKALANKARVLSLKTPSIVYSPSANKVYKNEVEILNARLNIALRNKPHERQAILLANKNISASRRANPDMTPDKLKKVKGKAIVDARFRVGAKKESIEITDRMWEAIQAGAITQSKLTQILLNTDIAALKVKSMPRKAPIMSSSKVTRARTMLKSGYTPAEIASALGISTSTLYKVLE